ncbi:hypothetical protein HDU98_008813 [Podochytrium sp. JEL0797]|nr:hypothetical protein HDU98_008813 [Podochytrium sp. JEL0797]
MMYKTSQITHEKPIVKDLSVSGGHWDDLDGCSYSQDSTSGIGYTAADTITDCFATIVALVVGSKHVRNVHNVIRVLIEDNILRSVAAISVDAMAIYISVYETDENVTYLAFITQVFVLAVSVNTEVNWILKLAGGSDTGVASRSRHWSEKAQAVPLAKEQKNLDKNHHGLDKAILDLKSRTDKRDKKAEDKGKVVEEGKSWENQLPKLNKIDASNSSTASTSLIDDPVFSVIGPAVFCGIVAEIATGGLLTLFSQYAQGKLKINRRLLILIVFFNVSCILFMCCEVCQIAHEKPVVMVVIWLIIVNRGVWTIWDLSVSGGHWDDAAGCSYSQNPTTGIGYNAADTISDCFATLVALVVGWKHMHNVHNVIKVLIEDNILRSVAVISVDALEMYISVHVTDGNVTYIGFIAQVFVLAVSINMEVNSIVKLAGVSDSVASSQHWSEKAQAAPLAKAPSKNHV